MIRAAIHGKEAFQNAGEQIQAAADKIGLVQGEIDFRTAHKTGIAAAADARRRGTARNADNALNLTADRRGVGVVIQCEHFF